jgi:serine protease Do
VERALRALPRDLNVERFFSEGLYGSSRRLGVMVAPMSDQLAAYFGVKEGVLISEVLPNTPAASAGLKAGDVVTAVNGRGVAAASDLTRELRDAQSGSALELRVTRDRKEITVKITVPERRVPTRGTPI